MHLGSELYTVVKFFHVIFAATWVGTGIYSGAVMGPAIMQSTPSTRREFMGRIAPVNMKWNNMMGGFTILTGLATWYLQRDAFTTDDLWSRLVVFSLIGALALLYLLNFALRPTLRAMEKVMTNTPPNEPPPPNLRFLQKRMAVTSGLMLLILVMVLAAMVAANAYAG